MDPIKRIQSDRLDARNHGDPNADLCSLALATGNLPSVRTLVLRDVTSEGFTLFINKTSDKWAVIQQNNQAELLLWYTNSQTQYRISGTLEALDAGIIAANWTRRPTASKYLDLSYQTLGPQGSEISSREVLIDHITQLKADYPEEQLTAPDSATGIILRPETIECLDLNMPNRIHDRQRFTRVNGEWQPRQLIP